MFFMLLAQSLISCICTILYLISLGRLHNVFTYKTLCNLIILNIFDYNVFSNDQVRAGRMVNVLENNKMIL